MNDRRGWECAPKTSAEKTVSAVGKKAILQKKDCWTGGGGQHRVLLDGGGA